MRKEESISERSLPPKAPGEFRIAHLSDLHFCTGKTPFTTRIKRLVYRSRPEGLDVIGSVLADLPNAAVDHVVITGDLTESARREEYEDAVRLLHPLNDPNTLSVVPGNHDVCYARRQKEKTRRTGVPMKLRRFIQHFGPLIPGAHPGQLPVEKRRPFPFVKILGGGQIALLGIDTTSPVPRRALPLNALGAVGKKQFRELQRLLTSEVLREKTKVILMHHHLLVIPFSQLGDGVRGLRGSRQLLELFYSARVDLVLHGHKHYPFCWQSHTHQRHDLAIVCAGPPNARWMDSNRLEDTLVYNIYSFKEDTVQIYYRACKHQPRQRVRTFRHHG